MSNVPIGGDLPSNSHKSREMKQEENKRPDIPEFQGEVAGVKRKAKGGSFLRWMRKMFLSDQKPSDILRQVVEQQIVPGIKDNFRNSLVSSVDMFIYQSAKPNTTSNNNVAYGKIFNSQSNASNKSKPQTEEKPDMNKGFTNPCFRSKMDATSFLIMMKEYDYPTLSVHTLYMMRKQHIDYTWDAYGWTREEIQNVQIVHINNTDYPWMIDLPQAHVIS